MKIIVKEENTRCGIGEFYDNIATQLGYNDLGNLNYDCTKILVSENICDNILKHYDKGQGAMLWVFCGPKVDSALSGYEVELQENFILFE